MIKNNFWVEFGKESCGKSAENATKADPQVGGPEISGSRTMIDTKTFAVNQEVMRGSSSSPHIGIVQRQASAKRGYHNTARRWDTQIHHTLIGADGPFMQRLREYNTAEVSAPVVGAYGECSSDLHSILATTATAMTKMRCRFICRKQSIIKQQIRQSLRWEMAILIDMGWESLLFDVLGSS